MFTRDTYQRGRLIGVDLIDQFEDGTEYVVASGTWNDKQRRWEFRLGSFQRKKEMVTAWFRGKARESFFTFWQAFQACATPGFVVPRLQEAGAVNIRRGGTTFKDKREWIQ